MKIACHYLEGTGPFGLEPRLPTETLIDPQVRDLRRAPHDTPNPMSTTCSNILHLVSTSRIIAQHRQGAMHQAHMRTKVAGSATCCIMQLDRDKKQLVAANLVRSASMTKLLNLEVVVLPLPCCFLGASDPHSRSMWSSPINRAP